MRRKHPYVVNVEMYLVSEQKEHEVNIFMCFYYTICYMKIFILSVIGIEQQLFEKQYFVLYTHYIKGFYFSHSVNTLSMRQHVCYIFLNLKFIFNCDWTTCFWMSHYPTKVYCHIFFYIMKTLYELFEPEIKLENIIALMFWTYIFFSILHPLLLNISCHLYAIFKWSTKNIY